jgi:hypothetical protein
MAARARSGDVGTRRPVSDPIAPRLWPAVLAAVSGSVMVGFMPWIARHLYADGLSAPSTLFWRYVLALAALIVAARAIGLDLRAAWRRGTWKVVLVGMTLGTAQTLCFWQSLKTLETGISPQAGRGRDPRRQAWEGEGQLYAALSRLRSTYCRMPPWRKYSSSSSVSMRHRSFSSRVPPPSP